MLYRLLTRGIASIHSTLAHGALISPVMSSGLALSAVSSWWQGPTAPLSCFTGSSTNLATLAKGFSAVAEQGQQGGDLDNTTRLQDFKPYAAARWTPTVAAAGYSADRPATEAVNTFTLKSAWQQAQELASGTPKPDLDKVLDKLEELNSSPERAGSIWLLAECGQWKDHPSGWQGPARVLMQMWLVDAPANLYDYKVFELDPTGYPSGIFYNSGTEVERLTDRVASKSFGISFKVLLDNAGGSSKKPRSLENFLNTQLAVGRKGARLKSAKYNDTALAAAHVQAKWAEKQQAKQLSPAPEKGSQGRPGSKGFRSILDD